MTITILTIGDPHFKISNIRDTDRMVDAILNCARQKQPDIIVVLGDVLDRHETVHVAALTRAVKFLIGLMEIAPTYVLIGNHDLKNNRQFLSDEHPFVSLKYINPERLKIVDTTHMKEIENYIFVFVPYVPNGRLEEALNLCTNWRNATCIFAHQELRGCQTGRLISTEGDHWSVLNPNIVSGHIHDYQEPQNNILYTGTPIQHAFGDSLYKTISLFTFHDNERIHERIDLGLPKKQIVKIHANEVSTYVPPENFELKITIEGTNGELKAIRKHPNIHTWRRNGSKIAYNELALDRPDNNNAPIIKEQLRFSTSLFNSIKTLPRVPHLYQHLFGIVNEPQKLNLKIITPP